jgi:membrane-bound lytic murein transglycosylase F
MIMPKFGRILQMLLLVLASSNQICTDTPPTAVHTGDLDEILERGTLRVGLLKKQTTGIKRQVNPLLDGRHWAKRFAREHGLQIKFVEQLTLSDAVNDLLNGRTDLLAEDLTITPLRQTIMAFTRPLLVTQEVLVGPLNADKPPTQIADLRDKEIHVRRNSSYWHTLNNLNINAGVGVKIVSVPEEEQTESILEDVAEGRRPLTLCDQHILDDFLAYNKQVKSLMLIAKDKRLAWAIRKENPDLQNTLNKFITVQSLTQHRDETSTGDLAALHKRGSLRLLTRNNALSYFMYKGEDFGFDRDLVKMFAKGQGLRLEIVVPPSRDLLIPWLLEGRGDMIAATMSVTPERLEEIKFSKPYLFVKEFLIQNTAGPKLKNLEDLKGHSIHVRKSSSYYSTLQGLQKDYGPFEIVNVSENIETERLLAQIASKEIAFSVADSTIFEIEQRYHDNIEAAFPLPMRNHECRKDDDTCRYQQDIAFGVRPNNPTLMNKLNTFISKTYRGLEYNMAIKRYFKNKKRIKLSKEKNTLITGEISPYDHAIKKYAKKYEFDWRLLAAQMYQESRFNPKAESWAGAQGLFQLMPRTARSLGIKRLHLPEQNIHAGVKYLRQLFNQTESSLQLRQRTRFALAAFNVGYGHLSDARRLAKRLKLDPDRWFRNVEKAMLLLEKPQYYKKARYGYCRGTEPVKYVSEIQLRYEHYAKNTTN